MWSNSALVLAITILFCFVNSTTTISSKTSTTSSSTTTSTSTPSRAAVGAVQQATPQIATTTTSISKASTSTTTTSSSSTSSSSSSSKSSSSPSSSTSSTTPSNCAPTYSASQSISGTGTLPKPTSFVKRGSGQGFVLDGSPFRVVGTNIYWICNDENVSTAPNNYYTDKGRIREALAIAVAMGANSIRLTSCGVSVGSIYSVEPSVGTFAQTGTANWDTHDYVIYAAGQYGLRVILPLTDDYDFYYGSKYTFLRAEGVSTGNFGNAFYTNQAVISDYETYITHILNHVNTYNNLAYKSDPTILAWETGNELGAYIGKEGYVPQNWTQSITSLIKSLAPSTLIMDGSDGFYNYSTKATAPGLLVSTVDIMSDHSYPRSIPLLNSQIPIATNANKAFIIGEFDWTNNFGGDGLSSYLSAVEATSYIGHLSWSIQGHDSSCCAFVPHNDGYSMYYPNGNSASDQANILLVVQHFYRMTGRKIPSVLPAVSCPQPVF